jgi:hypothetical protein
MKKILKILAVASMALFFHNFTYSQSTPPPPPPSHAQTGNQQPPGGGAPLGAGLPFLLAMAGFYGVRKYRRHKNQAKT